MISFPADLDIRLLRKEDAEGLSQWKLLAPQHVAHGDTRFVIPAGFRSNGASLPRILRAVWNPVGPDVAKAAFFHDFLYQNRGQVKAIELDASGALVACDLDLTRRQCDWLLYLSMRSLGAGRVKSILFYLGVRVGGGGNFYA